MRRRRKNQDKAKSQRTHTKRRLLERYGILFNREMYCFLLSQIHNGTAKFLRRQSNTRSVFEVYFCGEPIWVVYDKTRKEFRTALMLGCDLREVDSDGFTVGA